MDLNNFTQIGGGGYTWIKVPLHTETTPDIPQQTPFPKQQITLLWTQLE